MLIIIIKISKTIVIKKVKIVNNKKSAKDNKVKYTTLIKNKNNNTQTKIK